MIAYEYLWNTSYFSKKSVKSRLSGFWKGDFKRKNFVAGAKFCDYHNLKGVLLDTTFL